MQEKLIELIVAEEWVQFDRVQNEGGRAFCQDDFETFDIMRSCQFLIWSEEALESYLNDLKEAAETGRNLLSEKYGYMMEDTAPEAYGQIQNCLPAVTEEKRKLVNWLVALELKWMEEFRNCYPRYGNQGRPLRKTEAAVGETSLETYTRGEMMTYSLKTLKLLKEHWQMLCEQGINGGIQIMEATARRYGYRSAEHAEEFLKKLQENS